MALDTLGVAEAKLLNAQTLHFQGQNSKTTACALS
jgi:hypothetical protein